MKIRPFFLLTLLASATALAADPAPDAGPAPGDAEKNAVAELAKLGIDARPIAAGINWRAASVRLSTTKPDPKIFTLLKEVANLVELDLGTVEFTDADLAQLAGLANLRVLHVEKTATTDAQLAQLKGFKNLTYLNLYGTKITDAGLPQLNGLANLKSLYVFETAVTDAGIASLKQALPNVRVVKGWTAADIAKAAPMPDNKAAEAEIAEAQKETRRPQRRDRETPRGAREAHRRDAGIRRRGQARAGHQARHRKSHRGPRRRAGQDEEGVAPLSRNDGSRIQPRMNTD